ncbi:sensor histidine kinase [Cellulomonas taurus]|uniref:sensor histidine kinase n=1 Tax=Cellulomonas taurus TaxID=2729175 RepID=UPI00145FC1C4|nr:HAMP domain-containing sensor histidine kinase [Cellulomonas taurus]
MTDLPLRDLPSERALVLKHLPTVVGFAVALVVVALSPSTWITDPAPLTVGVLIWLIATGWALLVARRARGRQSVDVGEPWGAGDRGAVIVPLLSLVAIGLLRAGTGGSDSLFTALIVLPLIWIASEPGRGAVVLAAGAAAAVLVVPPALGIGPSDGLTPWRASFAPVVYALAALTVNELARRLREHLALSHTAERLARGVLDAVTEQAVVGCTPDGVIDIWGRGAERLLGAPAGRVVGRRRIEELFVDVDPDDGWEGPLEPRQPDDGRPGFSALVAGVEPGRVRRVEGTAVRGDDAHVPVELVITARRADRAQAAGYLVVATDLTPARDRARLQDQFVGMVSHELRTPVASVLGHLELVRDDPLTDDQITSLDVAERNAHRLIALVDDLLLTAQVDAGRLPVHLDELDLGQVLRSAVESVSPVAARAGVSLTVRASPGPVRGDHGRLTQVCDNLLSNAIKFTPAGGSVTATVHADGPDVVLAVADTGHGIPVDEVDRLFGRFFRSSTATRLAVPGVGLGLTITRAVVQAHGGSIAVASVEGRGATFTVRLPRLADR